ncbi:hypothetical protein GIB67_013904 [Kingdonia uniflora]|uniref:Uncharacterized protein n=1 Tax=Kingdonia uniflora TaxID=39325 RepID=A0A7J7LD55_9MAGN|nr:hypothetical protein GIB67_013904 [Kingdonia uniflora]
MFSTIDVSGDKLIEQSVKLLRVKDPLFKRMEHEKMMKVVELGGAHGLVNMLKAVKDDRTRKEALRELVALSHIVINPITKRERYFTYWIHISLVLLRKMLLQIADIVVGSLHLAGASSVISSTPDSSEDVEVMGDSSKDAEVMGYKSSLLKRFQDLKFDTTS